jgi:hypothetical protein
LPLALQITEHLAGEEGKGGGNDDWLWAERQRQGQRLFDGTHAVGWWEAIRGMAAAFGDDGKSQGMGGRDVMSRLSVSAKGFLGNLVEKSDVTRGAGASSLLLAC